MLRADGHQVTCLDAAVQPVPSGVWQTAGMIAFHLPMHTATRLAAPLIERARSANASARLCCYGLYAALNAPFLRSLGVEHIVGGEFEEGLRRVAGGLPAGDLISLERIAFRTPDRSTLPPLESYAGIDLDGSVKVAGYTEASRGCKHRCRHCPVVPVYQGKFRVVPAEVVLADIRQQAEAGAEHVTFGDPDFFNGPTHAIRIAEQLHAEFPRITYDATIKIEHLLAYRGLLPVLARTGCVLITSAVESVDDRVLALLDKGHTRADFVEAVGLTRAAGLNLAPTFIPFTPWTTRDSYRNLLRAIVDLDLVENVAAVQLALRLLIPAGSPLVELEDIRSVMDPFSPAELLHRWRHTDPHMDKLARELLDLVDREQKLGASRANCFAAIWRAASEDQLPELNLVARAAVPFLTEPWYC